MTAAVIAQDAIDADVDGGLVGDVDLVAIDGDALTTVLIDAAFYVAVTAL